jgi:hypothetical protein
MRTEEIAEMLGAEPWNVALSRDEALRRVAATVGMEGDEQLDEVRARLAELPAEEWLRPSGNGNGATRAAEPEPESPSEPEQGAAPAAASDPLAERVARANSKAKAAESTAPAAKPTEPSAKPAKSAKPGERRRRLLPALLAILGVVVVAVAIIASGGGSGDDGKQASSPPAATPAPADNPPPEAGEPRAPKGEPRPAPIALAPVGGSGAEGSVRLARDGDRLGLRVSGLPDPGADRYEVWLYDSVIEARRIGGARSGTFDLSAKLPRGWKRYRFLDVSRERADGNVSHSGRSVARVPVDQLR